MLPDRCKGCGFCIDFCKPKYLLEDPVANNKGYHLVLQDENIRCNGCGICTMICPEIAISVVKGKLAGEGKKDA